MSCFLPFMDNFPTVCHRPPPPPIACCPLTSTRLDLPNSPLSLHLRSRSYVRLRLLFFLYTQHQSSPFMTSSFATYASQFLNRQRSPGGATSFSPEQPLFFSFSTDDESQHGSGHLRRGNDEDLDDGGDPQLRSSENTSGLTSMMNTQKDLPDGGDDPYLRLDEVESGSQYPATTRLPGFSQAPSEQSRGWLAHQPMHPRSPSPSSSGLGDSPPIPSPPRVCAAFTPSPVPPPSPPFIISHPVTPSLRRTHEAHRPLLPS